MLIVKITLQNGNVHRAKITRSYEEFLDSWQAARASSLAKPLLVRTMDGGYVYMGDITSVKQEGAFDVSTVDQRETK